MMNVRKRWPKVIIRFTPSTIHGFHLHSIWMFIIHYSSFIVDLPPRHVDENIFQTGLGDVQIEQRIIVILEEMDETHDGLRGGLGVQHVDSIRLAAIENGLNLF